MDSFIHIVTGIPGAGKSCVLEHVLRIAPEISLVNYGKVMLEVADLKEAQRDQLRKLPREKQVGIGKRAAEKIALSKKGITLVDTHALIKTPSGYVPGIPHAILEILQPTSLIAICATPERIIERRSDDNARQRDADSLHQIQEHERLSLNFLAACSALSGATLSIIRNDHQSPEEVAQNFCKRIL